MRSANPGTRHPAERRHSAPSETAKSGRFSPFRSVPGDDRCGRCDTDHGFSCGNVSGSQLGSAVASTRRSAACRTELGTLRNVKKLNMPSATGSRSELCSELCSSAKCDRPHAVPSCAFRVCSSAKCLTASRSEQCSECAHCDTKLFRAAFRVCSSAQCDGKRFRVVFRVVLKCVTPSLDPKWPSDTSRRQQPATTPSLRSTSLRSVSLRSGAGGRVAVAVTSLRARHTRIETTLQQPDTIVPNHATATRQKLSRPNLI